MNMVNPQHIEQVLRSKVSEQISLLQRGLDRYFVDTPFIYDDGDNIGVILKKQGNQWILTDEGQTYLHLSYDIPLDDLDEGTRARIISDSLAMFSIEDMGGELVLLVPDEQFGDALYSFVQGILRISDVSFVSRERVRTTFVEDVRRLISAKVPSERIETDWNYSPRDPDRKYLVDYHINGMDKPIFVYALNSDAKVRDATISLLQFENWRLSHMAVGLFENQQEINRAVLARFSDVCDKQFSSLGGNQERIESYLDEALDLHEEDKTIVKEDQHKP